MHEAGDDTCDVVDWPAGPSDGARKANDGAADADDGVAEANTRVRESIDGVGNPNDGVREAIDGVADRSDGLREAIDGCQNFEQTKPWLQPAIASNNGTKLGYRLSQAIPPGRP